MNPSGALLETSIKSLKIIVVTVNYKSSADIIESLPEVTRQIREIGECQYWIVDNDSGDNSVNEIRLAIEANSCEDLVKCLASPVNRGFGAGNNVAFNLAAQESIKPRYFYLLNPDATPITGCIRFLYKYMEENENIAITGGPLYRPNGHLQCGGFRFPSVLGEFESFAQIGFLSKILNAYRIPIDIGTASNPVDWVPGANMIIRSTALDRVGLFDEGYFLYYEELDLCRRIIDVNLKIHILPEARVIHKSGLTTGMGKPGFRIPNYWYESRFRYFSKNLDLPHQILLHSVSLIGISLQRIKSYLKFRHPDPPYFFRDYLYNFINSLLRSRN